MPTAGLTVPFENARRAYYADKTWPVELRRNYTSATNALLRIPFEEGPGYLFRGGFPIVMNQFVFWSMYMTHYMFLKNKYFFMWTYNDLPYDWCKFCFHNFAFAVASAASYPCYYIREMVDLWPKERGGFCTWNNSYRQCFKWMVTNMDMQFYNFLRGYSSWFKRFGAQYYIALWVADSMGMMSNCNESYNSLETQFPMSSESV